MSSGSIYLSGVLAFVVTASAIPIVRRLAIRFGAMDTPNHRSSHSGPIPRLGGVAILMGFTVGCIVGHWLTGNWPSVDRALIKGALVGVALVGFIDDILGIKAIARMAVYLALSVVIWVAGTRISLVDIPGLGAFDLGTVGSLIVTVLFISWYTNLFNFMDGIDGIAGGAALITLGSLALLFHSAGEIYWCTVSAMAAAATGGFLLFNYSPASVFMGDGGSVFLGLLSGVLTVKAVHGRIITFSSALFLMLPFAFDATFTLLRRLMNRERVWEAHRRHVYQQMSDLGLSHRDISIIYTSIAMVLASLGLQLDGWLPVTKAVTWWACLVLLLLCCSCVLNINGRRQQKAERGKENCRQAMS